MKIFLAMPCGDMVHTQFLMTLLQMQSKHEIRYGFTMATVIYDARNILTENALKYGYDRVMWLDSDMIVQPDIIDRLADDIDEGRDFVTGLYFTRREEARLPVVFKDIRVETDGESIIPHADNYTDYPRDTLFRVAGCGFGACMMKPDVLQKVVDRFGQPFAPVNGFAEDLSFCKRCRDIGIDIWCDSRIKCGHIGNKVYTESDYANNSN